MLKRKVNPNEKTNSTPNKKPALSFTGTEPWKLVFNDARQAFTEAKYKEAIALFTRALSLQPNQASILDCRAASYEKLNNLDLGIADAITMIKRFPKDSRGYLRAGKLLSLNKKYDKAIQIYNRGLKTVDPNDARYDMINSMKQRAERLARPSTKYDPVVVLPYDVFSLVFSYLSFERRIQCTAVSRPWRCFALGWSGMWRDLEFTRKVSQKTVITYLKYAKGRHVRSFTIHHANRNLMTHVIQCLINEDCQYLEAIDFRYCDVPVTLFARLMRLMGKHVKILQLDDTDIDTKDLLQHIIPVSPALTHLSIMNQVTSQFNPLANKELLKSLTHLRCGPDNISFIDYCENVQVLEVYAMGFPFFNFYSRYVPSPFLESVTWRTHNNEGREFSDWKLAHQNPPISSTGQGLKTLEVDKDITMTIQGATDIFLQNPNIENLILLDCTKSFSMALMEHISLRDGLSNLKRLVLTRCPDVTESHLLILMTRCPLLEEVDLSMVMNVNDTVMNAFATHTRRLRVLDISDCNNVSGVGLQVLVRAHRKHLKKLKMNNCQRIGPDAVKWATDLLGARVIECKYRVK